MGVILYIEDNPDNLLLVRRAIEARGHAFHAAMTGEAGLQAADQLRPNLILLDINLPDIDGYEVARRLKGHEQLRGVPIIAVTANALKGDAEKALAAGCDQYMSKPINLRELWSRLTALIPAN